MSVMQHGDTQHSRAQHEHTNLCSPEHGHAKHGHTKVIHFAHTRDILLTLVM
jgi:hypothetical protein